MQIAVPDVFAEDAPVLILQARVLAQPGFRLADTCMGANGAAFMPGLVHDVNPVF